MIKPARLVAIFAISLLLLFLIGCTAGNPAPQETIGQPTASNTVTRATDSASTVTATSLQTENIETKSEGAGQTTVKAMAVETFLADIAQQVAGDRLRVDALMPVGVDPHSFEPTPRDIAAINDCDILIINGADLEHSLENLLNTAGTDTLIIEASAGIPLRTATNISGATPHETDGGHHHEADDPHYWLNPLHVTKYVENIRDGLGQVDSEGAAIYAANAESYIEQLRELDRWIEEQVQQIPQASRQLVTNHESLGYFADRYGFDVIGAVIPSVGTGASPSAQQLANLIDRVRETGARAVFLEIGANQQMAQQVASETGIKIVTDIYTHSVTEKDGPAPSYLEMMQHNTRSIVEALK